MARLLVANSSQETGAVLLKMLLDRGLELNKAEPTICYGHPTKARPALNSNCGFSKIERMELMNAAGVRTVPWFEANKDFLELPKDFKFPALARKAHGYGGTDIVPVMQPEEIPWRIAAGWDWFSSYIPVRSELRVWVFQGEHLDTYEKVMARPQEFKYIGRNFRNGFEFQPRKEVYYASSEAMRAVEAIGLDFGAVDMLIGTDGLPYVLEVNTAPGVLRSKAEPTLQKLADKMIEWALLA
jgi:D-alanine-D-alanine ligase